MSTVDTLARPRDVTDRENPAVLYAKSYLLIRAIVGLVGIVLPIVFIVGEAYLLRGGVHVRGSLSAYYHSSMRDLFVAGLCVTGFLLITYMAGQRNTPDFWFSLVAGVAVLGVVFFPTWRPGLAADSSRCGSAPEPAGCSPVQQQLGEGPTAAIHFACAGVFILGLAAIAFLFAYREKACNRNSWMAAIQKICGWTIIAAVGWVAVGEVFDITIWKLTPLYVGEVASVWAFGLSWILTSRDLGARLAPSAAHRPGREVDVS